MMKTRRNAIIIKYTIFFTTLFPLIQMTQIYILFDIFKPALLIMPIIMGLITGFVVGYNRHKILEQIKQLEHAKDGLTKQVAEEVFKNRKKDKLMFEHSKMASMGEMLGNIAHQWRQPLSAISTLSTGMLLQKECDILSDKEFEKACNTINNNAQYLSNTINDFKDFLKHDRTKLTFILQSTIDSFLNLVNVSIKNNNINVIVNIQKDIQINGFKNELLQCLINIFNNSKDMLIENNIKEKFVFITATKKDNIVKILLKDNAGGIPKNVLPKIFEPYFTTKHQSQGTGLGLHMTYNLIIDSMNGDIQADTVKFDYNGENYIGAEFIIILPPN